MTRAFRAIQFGLVLLTLVLFVGTADAEKKGKIGILGIEAVVGADGAINPADTQFAKDLTKELRSRANNSSMYEPVKDTRELVDEKLMNNCNSEHASCMAPIGQSMSADVLLFGKVENTKGGFKVSLKLVSVSKKQQIASDPNVFISTDNAKSSTGLANWVKERYRKLTGETSDGTLIVKVNAGGGRVLINGETKETLKSGSAQVSLPEGRYKVGIDADGFRLWEKDGVTISAERPTELAPELTKSDITKPDITDPNPPDGKPILETENTVSGKKNKTMFKVAAAVGLGGAALTGAYWGYLYFVGPIADFKDHNVNGLTFTKKDGTTTNDINQDHCGGEFSGGAGAGTANTKFKDACSATDKTKILAPVTIGLALIGGAALVYVLVSKDDTESRAALTKSGRQKKRRNLMVTPVVTPDGTGATLRFDW